MPAKDANLDTVYANGIVIGGIVLRPDGAGTNGVTHYAGTVDTTGLEPGCGSLYSRVFGTTHPYDRAELWFKATPGPSGWVKVAA